MANRLGIETEASENERILQGALARVAKPKPKAPVAVPPAPETDSEPVAIAKDIGRGARGAALGFGRAVQGPAAASAETMEGVYDVIGARKAPGVTGDTSGFENVMMGLKRTVMGAIGMPMAVLDIPAATLAGAIEGIRPGSLDVEILSHGGTVRDFTSGPPDPKNAEAMRHHNGPMTAREALSLLGMVATGAAVPSAVGPRGAGAGGKQKPLSAKEAKMAADKAAFEKSLAEASAKDTKAAEARAARQAANEASFQATQGAEPNPRLKQAPEVDAVLNVESAKPAAPVEFRGLQETSPDGSTPPMELWHLTKDIEGHPAGSTVSRQTLEAQGFTVPPADPPVTLYRHGKPEGPLSNFGESEGMVSPFRDAGALHSVEMTAAQAESYRKSNILKDPNADPAIKAEIERQGGMPEREFLLPEEQAKGAKEVYPEVKPAAAEAQPLVPDPVVAEAPSAPLPEVQTLADAHGIAQRVTAEAMTADVAPSGRMAGEFVQALQKSTGFSRAQLRAQGSEIVKFLEKEAAKAEDSDVAALAEVTRIKARLDEIAKQLDPPQEIAPAEVKDALARRVTAALLDPKTLENQPDAAIKSLTDVGVPKKKAEGIVQGVMDAYKASGLADETGHMFFWGKDANKTQPVFDVKAAEASLGSAAKTAGLTATLRLNVLGKKAVTPEQVVAAKAATGVATGRVNAVLNRVEAGAKVNPGELFDSATLAGAVADKTRVADGRINYPGQTHGGTQPIKDAHLARFAEYLNREMTEPELYAKLKSLEPHQQQQWLANLYRASDIKGLKGTYMSLYIGAKLTGPETLARASMGDIAMTLMDIPSTALGAQIGKLLPGDKHIMPGEATIRATSFWKSVRDQMSMIGRRDWDGIKTQMVTEGEWNPPIANPKNLFSNIVNAIAGAPTYALGAQRASSKIVNRMMELDVQAHLKALEDRPKTHKEYVEAVEHYRRNPTVDMIRDANAHADAQTFSHKLDGILGNLQDMGINNGVKVLVSPFPRIDIGIFDMALQGTPGLNFASKAWRDAWNEGGRARDKAMGRLATGSAVIGTGMLFGMQGLVTGDGPSDHAQRKMMELQGWRSNYIYNPVTGKPMISHLALGPISGWLAMGADLSFMARHASEMQAKQLFAGAIHALGAPITHAGYLEAWGNVVGAIKNGLTDDDWLRAVRQKLVDMALLKPAILSYVTRQTQPEGRPDLATPRGDLIDREFKLLKDEITSGWPGWSKGFPTVKNFLTYEPIPRDGLMPWNQDVTNDVVAVELAKLGRKVGRTIIAPPDFIGGDRPAEGLASDKPGAGVRLEAWEKDRLLQIMAKDVEVKGLTLHEALADEIKSDQYQSAETDELRAARIFGLYTAFKLAAQGKLLQEDDHLRWLVAEQQVADARKMGMDTENPLGAKPAPTKYPRPSQIR